MLMTILIGLVRKMNHLTVLVSRDVHFVILLVPIYSTCVSDQFESLYHHCISAVIFKSSYEFIREFRHEFSFLPILAHTNREQAVVIVKNHSKSDRDFAVVKCQRFMVADLGKIFEVKRFQI